MNRLLVLLVLTIPLAMVANCREDSALPKGSAGAGAKSSEPINQGATDTISDSLHLDSLFDAIRVQEATLAAYPSNDRLASSLVAASLDTVAGCFYTIGKGARDTSLPETAQPVSQKIAAKFAAEKWALYCKAWHAGNKIPYGTTVSGKVNYSKDIRARMKNDTLFLMLMVPEGSVVLKK
jgi:hypothetical protein